MPGQYRVFLPPAVKIATRHRGMLATRCCKPSTGNSAHLSNRAEFTKTLGRVFHTADCTAHFFPNMFYGVAVWRSCKLLHLGDIAELKEIKNYPSTFSCGSIVLLAVVITEKLSSKWP